MWLLTTHQSDLAPEVEDVMEQAEQKVAADARHSTTESPRVRTSPSPRIDNIHPNPKTTSPQMRRHQLTLLPSASKHKTQLLSWLVRTVELPLLHYGGETRAVIRFATLVVRVLWFRNNLASTHADTPQVCTTNFTACTAPLR
jgi:hypothetical protein